MVQIREDIWLTLAMPYNFHFFLFFWNRIIITELFFIFSMSIDPGAVGCSCECRRAHADELLGLNMEEGSIDFCFHPGVTTNRFHLVDSGPLFWFNPNQTAAFLFYLPHSPQRDLKHSKKCARTQSYIHTHLCIKLFSIQGTEVAKKCGVGVKVSQRISIK